MMRSILLSCLMVSTLAYGQQAAVDVPSTCVTSPHPQENPQARQIFINKFKQLGFPGEPTPNQVRCVMNTPPDGRIAKIQEIIAGVIRMQTQQQGQPPQPQGPGPLPEAGQTGQQGPQQATQGAPGPGPGSGPGLPPAPPPPTRAQPAPPPQGGATQGEPPQGQELQTLTGTRTVSQVSPQMAAPAPPPPPPSASRQPPQSFHVNKQAIEIIDVHGDRSAIIIALTVSNTQQDRFLINIPEDRRDGLKSLIPRFLNCTECTFTYTQGRQGFYNIEGTFYFTGDQIPNAAGGSPVQNVPSPENNAANNNRIQPSNTSGMGEPPNPTMSSAQAAPQVVEKGRVLMGKYQGRVDGYINNSGKPISFHRFSVDSKDCLVFSESNSLPQANSFFDTNLTKNIRFVCEDDDGCTFHKKADTDMYKTTTFKKDGKTLESDNIFISSHKYRLEFVSPSLDRWQRVKNGFQYLPYLWKKTIFKEGKSYALYKQEVDPQGPYVYIPGQSQWKVSIKCIDPNGCQRQEMIGLVTPEGDPVYETTGRLERRVIVRKN